MNDKLPAPVVNPEAPAVNLPAVRKPILNSQTAYHAVMAMGLPPTGGQRPDATFSEEAAWSAQDAKAIKRR